MKVCRLCTAQLWGREPDHRGCEGPAPGLRVHNLQAQSTRAQATCTAPWDLTRGGLNFYCHNSAELCDWAAISVTLFTRALYLLGGPGHLVTVALAWALTAGAVVVI